MNVEIAEFRKDFTAYIVDRDAVAARTLAKTIRAVGYEDTRFCPTLDSALAMARESPPHIVLFEMEGFAHEAESFLTDIRDISEEILPIVIAGGPHVLPALGMVSRRLAFDVLARPFSSSFELIQKMDRAATQLFYKFESEQLREHFSKGQGVSGDSTVGLSLQPPSDSALTERDIDTPNFTDENSDEAAFAEFIERWTGGKDLEQTTQIFLESTSKEFGGTPVLYFKYVPSHVSLLFSQAAWLPVEKYRGVGIDLSKENPALLTGPGGLLQMPEEIPAVQDMIRNVFGSDQFAAVPHIDEGEVLGIVVGLGKANFRRGRARSLRRIFEVVYKKNLILKEKHALDITDPVTGVTNRRHFGKILDDEIARSRRILMPVSLIVLDIRGFRTINEKMGYRQADTVLWTFAAILKKTTRKNDVIARLGPDEFACVLPHTGIEGATVKAERIRRMIEAAKIPLLEKFSLGPLHVSCGVSEYPSIAGDADALLRVADDALAQVKKAGGNRVCLATKPEGFTPDFVPQKLESNLRSAQDRFRAPAQVATSTVTGEGES